MKKYYTGYICFEEEVRKPLLKGKGFQLTFEKTKNNENQPNTKEVIIHAASIGMAKDVSALIYSAITLLHSCMPAFTDDPSEPTEDEDRSAHYREGNVYTFSMQGIVSACQIACKASALKANQYALLKYLLACKLHSNEPIDIDPIHSQYHPLNHYRKIDHVRIGYAIVLFYSVLEEIGLEIKASSKKPSLINNKWNEEVKAELNERLRRNNINLKEKILWNMRSKPTSIEKRKPPINKEKANWAKYDTRDSFIEICDAIRITSWIRSTIVSHKLDQSIDSISIYDVANANQLARQILLDMLFEET